MPPARNFIFHPATAWTCAVVAACAYAAWATVRFDGEKKLASQYFYVTPIIVPFILFSLARAEFWQETLRQQKLLDAAVILTVMWRVIGDVPYVSGHVLFLSYALLDHAPLGSENYRRANPAANIVFETADLA